MRRASGTTAVDDDDRADDAADDDGDDEDAGTMTPDGPKNDHGHFVTDKLTTVKFYRREVRA